MSNFSHNIAALFRALFTPFTSKNLPLGSRVDSTKMTNSRLRALETPDHLKEKHIQALKNAEAVESGEFQTYTSEEEVAKRVKSLADMSQYRLAALARELPPDKIEESKD
ncbi:MAG: hypothetical protein JST89_23125 [Cyanobacteria bacterium SZAS-4]|nr:hypothetical protein [Cyanobacteria bacterium SZAS-4]